MFFILRCVFWLSLVFLHLPDGQGRGAANQFLDMAGRHAEAIARQSVASAAGAGAAWCQSHGEACADAVLATMRTKSNGLSFDTLTAADRGVPATTRKRG